MSTDLDRLERLIADYRGYVVDLVEQFAEPAEWIATKAELESTLNDAVRDISSMRKRGETLREENRTLEARAREIRHELNRHEVERAKLQTRAEAVGMDIIRIKQETEEHRLIHQSIVGDRKDALSAIKALVGDTQELTEERAQIVREERELSESRDALKQEIVEKHRLRTSDAGDLENLRTRLQTTNKEEERLNVVVAQINTEIRATYDLFRQMHGRDLSEFEHLLHQEMGSVDELRVKVDERKQSLKQLGHVNLMAPEEFGEIEKRYEFLKMQIDDLQTAREDLRAVIREVRSGSIRLFLQSFDQIKQNFQFVFRRLFGGGKTELRLADPNDVLDSGIEIFAQPPGKKLEHISLLSGGERSMMGVALLFAMLKAKPSPFCILDEIDAALDEQNVGRFVRLLDEFGERTQFIIVTHNKKTVSAAGSLVGITMEETGISQVVSVRLDGNGIESG